MAYTKTNLNETTETVAVDMAAEDKELLEELPFDETTETVVEQNARGYSKTVWNESTPITADKLNKMETGIANGIDKTEQVMEIPIINSEGWQQFRWTKPNYNTISWTRDAPGKKAIEIYNETTRKRLLLLDDDGNLATAGNLNPQGFLVFSNLGGGGTSANIHNLALHANTGNGQMMTAAADRIYVGNPNTHLALESTTVPEVNIGGNTYFLYHTGNFNPATKLDAGNFSISNRDLKIYGKRALVGFNTPDGNYLSINHDRDFANGVAIHGHTVVEEMENSGKLTFYNQMGGGQMSSLINCQELQNNTGNGQMLTASVNRIFVGNPNTQLVIESSSNPIVNADGGSHSLYHTGNKPTANDVGALPIGGGTLTGSLKVNGSLAFSNLGGGGLNANIHNTVLHAYTGNGQMMAVGSNTIYVGNSLTHLTLESNTGIIADINGAKQRILTERDSCHRFSWNGSRISIDNGGNNAAVSFSDTSEVARHIHNHHTGRNFKFRADAGLGPLEGEITFTW